MTCAIIGLERGSLRNTEHLQGYCEFSTPLRLARLKTLLQSKRIHAECSKGSGEANWRYCSKEGQPIILYGTPSGDRRTLRKSLKSTDGPGQFHETALKIQEDIKQGVPERELWNDNFAFMLRYNFGVRQYLRMQRPNRLRPPVVEAIIGPPGTGKTRYVHDFAYIFYNNAEAGTYDPDLWSWGGSGPWFDGYSGQRVALFDDYRGSIPLESFLKALDRYDNLQPIKGGFVWFSPVYIFITSNDDVVSWYPDGSPGSIAALQRRIRVSYLTEPLVFGRLNTLLN